MQIKNVTSQAWIYSRYTWLLWKFWSFPNNMVWLTGFFTCA